MIVKWIKYKDGYVYTTDITEAVSSVSWGGSTSQAARTAEIAVINAPNDKNVTDLKLKIAAGDTIKLYENNTTLFIGEVITKETTSETGTVTYSCTDLLNHLLKSTGVYNFSNTTAERITKKVCADFEIDTGTVVETKATIKKMIIDGSSISRIKYIVKAYERGEMTLQEVNATMQSYFGLIKHCTNEGLRENIINGFVLHCTDAARAKARESR